MPIIKSAKKRVRVSAKATIRNVKTKRSVKSAIKTFQSSLTGGGKKTAETLNHAQSELDKAVKKGVIHKNKAARQKKQLAAKAKAAGMKTTTTAKKTTAKKPASKRSTAVTKSTTGKSTPAKKPAAKKTATKKTAKK